MATENNDISKRLTELSASAEAVHELLRRRLDRLATADLSEEIVAVDFDGTCVEHVFPEVGNDVPFAVEVLKALAAGGAKLILWTMRSDKNSIIIGSPTQADAAYYLTAAREWFEARDIPLYGVNENPQQVGWTSSPKAYAHTYIDDAALGCPLVYPLAGRPYVDWQAVAEKLVDRFLAVS